jgi:hypothetical protein
MKDFKEWREKQHEAVGDPVSNTNATVAGGDITPEEEDAYNREIKGGRLGTLLNLLKSEITNKISWFQTKPNMMGKLIEDVVDALQLKNNPGVLHNIFNRIKNKTSQIKAPLPEPVKPQPMPQVTSPQQSPQQVQTQIPQQQQNDMF